MQRRIEKPSELCVLGAGSSLFVVSVDLTPSRPYNGAARLTNQGPRKSMADVTRILNAIEQGDANAADELLPLVYEELRLLAARKMSHESPGQTLQATALVHEAYIRLSPSRFLTRPLNTIAIGNSHNKFALGQIMGVDTCSIWAKSRPVETKWSQEVTWSSRCFSASERGDFSEDSDVLQLQKMESFCGGCY